MRKLALLFALWCAPAFAQVPVSQAPPIKFQFLTNAGVPVANGCLSTFIAGTSTPQATYVDSTGISQNANPIILDAAGRADIWLPNASFKFVLKTAGGVACASGAQLWSVDGVSGILGLLNLTNVWTGANSFSQAVTITPNTNQIILGVPGNQVTINSPAPAANVTLNLPNTADTLVGRATTDTLTNKTLTSPMINTPVLNNPSIGGVTMSAPATFVTISPNCLGAPGTVLNTLATINGSCIKQPLITDTSGVVGIVVSGAGITGTPTIQQTGIVNCVFDGAAFLGDYAQISPTVAGNCHDPGVAAYPGGGQVLGRVLQSNLGGGSLPVLLFSPEIQGGPTKAFIGGAGYSNSTTTFSTIPNQIFSVNANANYKLSCIFIYQGSAATAGPKFQLLGPAAPTAVNISVEGATATASYLDAVVSAFSSSNAVLGSLGSTGTNLTAHVDVLLINGPNAGGMTVQAAANGAGTLTILAASGCALQ